MSEQLELSKKWMAYMDTYKTVSPTSVEAQQGFSRFSQLRSKFKSTLHKHFSATLANFSVQQDHDLDPKFEGSERSLTSQQLPGTDFCSTGVKYKKLEEAESEDTE